MFMLGGGLAVEGLQMAVPAWYLQPVQRRQAMLNRSHVLPCSGCWAALPGDPAVLRCLQPPGINLLGQAQLPGLPDQPHIRQGHAPTGN